MIGCVLFSYCCKPYALYPHKRQSHTLLNQISTRSKPISYGPAGMGLFSKRSASLVHSWQRLGVPCLQLLSAQHNKSNKRTADTKYTCWLNTYIHRLCVISQLCAHGYKKHHKCLACNSLSAGLQSISLNGRQLPELRGRVPK